MEARSREGLVVLREKKKQNNTKKTLCGHNVTLKISGFFEFILFLEIKNSVNFPSLVTLWSGNLKVRIMINVTC